MPGTPINSPFIPLFIGLLGIYFCGNQIMVNLGYKEIKFFTLSKPNRICKQKQQSQFY
jgi:hypothetical protein